MLSVTFNLLLYHIGARYQCYEAFYGRKFGMFLVSWSVCPSLIFVGKAKSLPKSGAPKGDLQALHLAEHFCHGQTLQGISNICN